MTEFGRDLFANCPKLTVYCPFHSYATLYVIDNNINFIASDTNDGESENFVLSKSGSVYFADLDSANVNGYIKMIVQYKLKEQLAESISDKNVQIRMSANFNLKEDTICIEGVMCQNYTYEDNLLTVPVVASSGTISFYISPQDSEKVASYAQMTFRKDGRLSKEIIGIINEEMNRLTISAENMTSGATVQVSGVGPKSTEISLYIDDKIAGSVSTSKSGRYSAKVTIDAPVNKQQYVISAKEAGGQTAQQVVTYQENIPEVTSFDLYYNNHSNAAINLLNSSSIPYISFNPSVPFTFTVGVTNQEQVEDVYIVSTRNNEKRFMEAKYNAATGKYVASGYFDENNHSYVPGSFWL